MVVVLEAEWGWFGQSRKISPPPAFNPRTVQPIQNPYAD
jgi:hypothetical protein